MSAASAAFAAEVDRRLGVLLGDVADHSRRLYACESIGASESLPLLRRLSALVEACLSISSQDSVEDVIEALDEAVR